MAYDRPGLFMEEYARPCQTTEVAGGPIQLMKHLNSLWQTLMVHETVGRVLAGHGTIHRTGQFRTGHL